MNDVLTADEAKNLHSLPAAGIDMAMSEARRARRSVQKCVQQAMTLATIDTSTAESMFYSLPRADKKIEGPTIRMAEIIAHCWTNLRVGSRVSHIDNDFVVAEGVAHDLETNNWTSTEVRRSIRNKNGNRYGADMIQQTANAAMSIAYRNVVFRAIPVVLLQPIFDRARKVAIGDEKTVASRRQGCIEQFGKMGVTPEQLAAHVKIARFEEVYAVQLFDLRKVFNGIREGDTSVDGVFGGAGYEGLASKADQMVAKLQGQAKDEVELKEPTTGPERLWNAWETKAIPTDPPSDIDKAAIITMLELLHGDDQDAQAELLEKMATEAKFDVLTLISALNKHTSAVLDKQEPKKEAKKKTKAKSKKKAAAPDAETEEIKPKQAELGDFAGEDEPPGYQGPPTGPRE